MKGKITVATAIDPFVENFVRDTLPDAEDQALQDATAYCRKMKERLYKLEHLDELQLAVACEMP